MKHSNHIIRPNELGSTAMRLHDTYDGLAPNAPLGLDDIAAIGQVKRDTAYRWTIDDGFPGRGDNGLWRIDQVVDWLCRTGRLEGCEQLAGLVSRAQVATMTGLSESSIKVYIWQGTFPRPDAPRVGKSPRWQRATIESWLEARVDRRRTEHRSATA